MKSASSALADLLHRYKLVATGSSGSQTLCSQAGPACLARRRWRGSDAGQSTRPAPIARVSVCPTGSSEFPALTISNAPSGCPHSGTATASATSPAGPAQPLPLVRNVGSGGLVTAVEDNPHLFSRAQCKVEQAGWGNVKLLASLDPSAAGTRMRIALRKDGPVRRTGVTRRGCRGGRHTGNSPGSTLGRPGPLDEAGGNRVREGGGDHECAGSTGHP